MSALGEMVSANQVTMERQSFFRCKLCWRIGISIFAAILFIEAVILVFSAQRFEMDQIAEIETRGIAWITTIIRVHNNVMDAKAVEAASHELPQLSKILGLTLYSLKGEKIDGFGELPDFKDVMPTEAGPVKPIRSLDGNQYQAVWGPGVVDSPFIVAARLDISDVKPALIAFVWRIVGLVILISVVVTFATLIVFGVFVLMPIMKLRNQLNAAGEDPDNPEAYTIDNIQNDELGEVTQAFNNMVQRLAAGIARIRAHEDALQSANDLLEERVNLRTKELSNVNRSLRQVAVEREKAEQEVSRLTNLPGQNPEPVLRVDLHGTIEYANEPSQVLLDAWNSEVGDQLPEKLSIIVKDVVKTRQKAEVEFPAADKVFTLAFQPSEATSINVFGRDITSHREAEDRMQHLANHDLLTGLPNRTLFNDRLRQSISQNQRKRGRMAVQLVNLDNFRELNNTLGLKNGDCLLQETAERLKQCLRASDSVARLGGDEFAVIQAEPKDAHGAATLAQKMIDHLSAPYHIGREIHSSASVGITLYPDDETNPEQLLRNADLALNQAKEEDAGNYRFFIEAMNDEIQKRQSIEADLRMAIERSEFVLHYQPKINLNTNSVAGMEVLIRWIHPDKGFMSPADFIPVAEQTRQIIPIGEWVLREACNQAKEWQNQGLPPLKLAVNLSAVQFSEHGLPDLVSKCLGESKLDSNQLELEITETVIMDDVNMTTDILSSLNNLGPALSIDDFGTGYSSLSYLERFPVNRIKIDKSFVDGIGNGAGSEAIANAVITLGHSLGMEVTAEGVEEENQVDFLRQQNCDEIQGYYFSKPISAEEFPDFVRNFAKN